MDLMTAKALAKVRIGNYQQEAQTYRDLKATGAVTWWDKVVERTWFSFPRFSNARDEQGAGCCTYECTATCS